MATTEKTLDPMPVVMATWKRIHRLPTTLQLLLRQTHPLVFHIWNNNIDARDEVDCIVRRYQGDLSIHVTHSMTNLGCFARFYAGRKLKDRCPYVIFIDDDQEFDENMVKGFAEEAKPEHVYSQHAWLFKKQRSYWERYRARPDQQAHYCGMCGLVVDTSIFSHDAFFGKCPEKYRMGLDDLWLSFFAHHILGWTLKGSSVRMTTILDAEDTWQKIKGQKTEFLWFLRESGWKV